MNPHESTPSSLSTQSDLHGPAGAGVLDGLDLTDRDLFAHGFPHDVFTALRLEAPVFFHPPGNSRDGEGFWVLSRYSDIVEAAADQVFSSEGVPGRWGGGTHIDDLPRGTYAGVILNMTDDPRHGCMKRAVAPAFEPDVLADLEPHLRSSAARLVANAVGLGRCDFQTDVSGPFSVDAISLLLGVPPSDWPQIFAWTQVAMGYEDRQAGEATVRSQDVLLDMYNYGCKLLETKQAEPARDFLSVIGAAELPEEAGEPITDYERGVFFNLMSLAGTEPTRNALAMGMLALAEHPEQWCALRDDPSSLGTGIEEILRWSSPTPYNRRTAVRDVRLSGESIRAGDKVTLWWASANRDESVFADPFRFDVRRDPNPHVGFGAGGHSCLGDRLARLELRVLLEELLAHVDEVRIAGQVTWARHNKHTVVLEMPVEIVPRSGSIVR